MNQNLIRNLQFSYAWQQEGHAIPNSLKESLQLISDYFSTNTSNKLCIVFPSKEYSAQWLSVPIVLNLIESDYALFKNEIIETHKQFIKHDKLRLNGKAIVELISINPNGVTFKTKAIGESSGAEITIAIADVIKLQKVDIKRKLSSLKTVKASLPNRTITALENLLKIEAYGNMDFIKNKVCLVSKYKSYEDSIENAQLNNAPIAEYFQFDKLDENRTTVSNNPLMISNNLSTLSLHVGLYPNSISKIIIDGFSTIENRLTDFFEIDVNNIPTILITDLSEIDRFENIGNCGFQFFNFTKEYLKFDDIQRTSPFQTFENKLKNYATFKLVREICHDSEIEDVITNIHSIEQDTSNQDLLSIKFSLIQLINIVSRIAYVPKLEEISILKSKLNNIETLFLRNKIWLGNSNKLIEDSISILKSILLRFEYKPSEKFAKLKDLLSLKDYDCIICATEDEAKTLNLSFPKHIYKPKILSIADVNTNLLSSKPKIAILIGWPKSNNMNRIISSFIFSELTVLFYKFENDYYNSLQKRNRRNSENIRSTLNNTYTHTKSDSTEHQGFSSFYSDDKIVEIESSDPIDIMDFEFKLDNAHYSRYAAKGNSIESIRARRILFENNLFIHTTESHKFIILNELMDRKRKKTDIHKRKVESLQTGDVIALINTDRDLLVELVEKNTNTKELVSVKQWTELWKILLKNYYSSIGSDFKKLIEELRKNDCKKHEVTIKTWLQDESRIGPDDDADLISIALLTKSELLLNNIKNVRDSITKMKGWRHNASDFIISKIKAQIHQYADSSIINKQISIEGLGSVFVLKIIEISNAWESIDARYVNRLLQKEII